MQSDLKLNKKRENKKRERKKREREKKKREREKKTRPNSLIDTIASNNEYRRNIG